MDSVRVSLWSARRALLFLVLAGALAGAGCEDSTAKKQAIATPPYSAIGLPDTSFGQPDPDPDHAHLRLGYITFGNVTGGGIMDDQGLALALQPGGAILVGGVRSRTGGTDLGDMAVWRLASNGTLDTSFGTAGVTISDSGSDNLDEAWDMTLDSQGRIVLVGSTQAAGFSDEFTVWRMNANGAFDASFNGTGTRVIANVAGGGNASDQALGVAVDASDRVLVAGTGVNAGDNNAFLIRHQRDTLSGLVGCITNTWCCADYFGWCASVA